MSLNTSSSESSDSDGLCVGGGFGCGIIFEMKRSRDLSGLKVGGNGSWAVVFEMKGKEIEGRGCDGRNIADGSAVDGGRHV